MKVLSPLSTIELIRGERARVRVVSHTFKLAVDLSGGDAEWFSRF
jgi:hypothetical protein